MDSTLLGVAALATLAAVVQTLRLWWRDLAARRAWALRKRVAARGELDAERLLARAGFAVIDRQIGARLTYRVDGEAAEVDVRADLLVEKGGRRYVAEVKTGEQAPRPTNVATRRQLLEYAHAFGVDRLLLVDASEGTIREVAPPRALPAPRARAWVWVLVALAGLALVWAALRA